MAPRVLSSGGLCVIGGSPKVGKSDFLLNWLLHMSAGLPFLGMTPPRPLRIAYLQAEVGYHFICERVQLALQKMELNKELTSIVRQNLFFTRNMEMIFDKKGIELMRRCVLYHFDDPVDIIAIDPLRDVFDGGASDKSENDNGAMKSFLRKRIGVLRNSINPDAANILVHHLKKLSTEQLESEEFQALAGASALHCHFSTGILMYKPDPKQKHRKLIFELRNGNSTIDPKNIEKIDGRWEKCDSEPEPLIRKKHSNKMDMEHKRDIILQTIRSEAYKGKLYTIRQFCEAFSDKIEGRIETLRKTITALVSDGYIKFFNNTSQYGLKAATGSKYGYICVENMQLKVTTKDKETAEEISNIYDVKPSHFRCKETDLILPLKDEKTYEYFNEEKHD